MKKNLLLFFAALLSFPIFAQDYQDDWRKVLDLESNGLIQDASEKVDELHKIASSEKNEAEIIKTFFFQSKYLMKLEEKAQHQILINLQKEKLTFSPEGKALMDYIYIVCLEKYLDKYRYNISRPVAEGEREKDFTFWSKTTLEAEITQTFEKIIAVETLKNVSLEKYELIFEFDKKEQLTKESVYEYLLGKYIVFLEKNLGFSDLKLNEEQKNIVSQISNFYNASLDFIEDENVKKVLWLYQKVEKIGDREMILNRGKLINRLISENSDSKTNSFLEFLDRIKKNADDNLLQKVLLEKATIFNDRANLKDFPDDKKKAVAALDSILAIENRSNTYKKAFLLNNNITQKTISLTVKEDVYEGENTLTQIEFKDVDSIKLNFFRVDARDFEKCNRKEADSISKIIASSQTPAYSTISPLPNLKNYLHQSTEILLPKLKIGDYLVVPEASDVTANYSTKNMIVKCTNLFASKYSHENKDVIEVSDRKTGQPVAKAKVKIGNETKTTDRFGNAVFKKKKKSKNSSEYAVAEIIAGEDNYTFQLSRDYRSTYYPEEDENYEGKINIFLDRAIYRPGQTVYGKGILYQKKNGATSVVPNTSVAIEIKGPNYKTVKEFTAITNEFGSFVFEFVTLPGVSGEYSIDTDEPDNYENDILFDKKKDEHPFWDNADVKFSGVNFMVEEYKRPTFEVKFNPTTEDFQLEKDVFASGSSKAFAGSNVSNAKVVYKISRQTNSRKNLYFSSSEIIAEGETTTDDSGNFKINFKANPGKIDEKINLPVVRFSIEATVTDVNGESRSNQTYLSIGYHNLVLSATIPSDIKNDEAVLRLNSTNLNQQFKPITGKISVYLQSELKVGFIPYYTSPTHPIIADEDFGIIFPYSTFPPHDENKSGTLVFSQEVNTAENLEIKLDVSKYKNGNYRLVFEADDLGNKIETHASFAVTRGINFNPKKMLVMETVIDSVNDGFAKIKISSPVPNLFVRLATSQNEKAFQHTFVQLKNNEAIVKIPIENKLKPEIQLFASAVFENYLDDAYHLYDRKEEIQKIDIEVLSFKNKFQPGSAETWSFKMKELDKKMEAEVLASMYDSSLDQFQSDSWNAFYFSRKSWGGFYREHKSHPRLYTTLSQKKQIPEFSSTIEKPELLWFGFDFVSKQIRQNKNYTNEVLKTKIPKGANVISGVVGDSQGLPLPGASVQVVGKNRSTQTDFDGYYEIEALPNEKISFQFIGFKTFEIVAVNKQINVSLYEDEVAIDAVVVEGYRSTTKKLSSNAVTVMSVELDGTQPIQSLQGQIPGLNISTGPGQPGSAPFIILRGSSSINGKAQPLIVVDGVPLSEDDLKKIDQNDITHYQILKNSEATAIYGNRGINGALIITTKASAENLAKIQTRKNFNETAFFFPQHLTDKEGKISFNFTSPEALTSWKFRLFAHTKKAVSGYLELNAITQKKIMITPNFPRFLRENDTIILSAKIANLTSEIKSGSAMLQLFDAVSMQPVDAKALNVSPIQSFSTKGNGTTTVSWKIFIPEGLQGLQYKIVAQAGNFSDGEENVLPVLSNRTLITESLPIFVLPNSEKKFTLKNFQDNKSETLQHHQFTFEYASNPTWFAIQSLPYLMEYEHECAEQTFARYFANALASEIVSSNPKIETVLKAWSQSDKSLSKINANEELKSIAISETPWLLDVLSDDEKKKMFSNLFNSEKLTAQKQKLIQKLQAMQNPSGAFPWFEGGTDSENITTHIISGLGKLKKIAGKNSDDFSEITKKAVQYLDKQFQDRSKNSIKNKNLVGIWDVNYLYARSFYLDAIPLSPEAKNTIEKSVTELEKNWLSLSLNEKAHASIAANRYGKSEFAKKIIENLRQTSANDTSFGMYWIENKPGWRWNEAPIETQAKLIEAFAEVGQDTASVEAMKVWLLKNKQPKNWSTTKSTTAAVFALVMHGKNWIDVKTKPEFSIGDSKILQEKLASAEVEANSGYVKLNWKSDEISPEMAQISVKNPSVVPGYGGVYWQYFENFKNIKSAGGPLNITKEIFLKKVVNNETKLIKISAKTPLKIGDLVSVRLHISASENIDYVHLKDLRASCFEPVDVLSKRVRQNNLWFYQSTKDVATHFFFDTLPKGNHVLDFDLRVNNAGTFSNGISTIQSMYAPEFSRHSTGGEIVVKE